MSRRQPVKDVPRPYTVRLASPLPCSRSCQPMPALTRLIITDRPRFRAHLLTTTAASHTPRFATMNKPRSRPPCCAARSAGTPREVLRPASAFGQRACLSHGEMADRMRRTSDQPETPPAVPAPDQRQDERFHSTSPTAGPSRLSSSSSPPAETPCWPGVTSTTIKVPTPQQQPATDQPLNQRSQHSRTRPSVLIGCVERSCRAHHHTDRKEEYCAGRRRPPAPQQERWRFTGDGV